MLELLSAIGSIILVDLVLSGDNALVIGAAAARLPRRQRWIAIAFGGGGAIVLRIVFAIIATLLLRLPLLQAIGGLLLLLISVRLLLDRDREQQKPTQTQSEENAQKSTAISAHGSSDQRGFWSALLTIVVADVTMSLDNVLAVGALAAGNIPLLAAGLLLSILLLLLGSALVAELIGHLPWLLDVAALVLAWTASNMILDDRRLGPILEHFSWTQFAIPLATLAIVIAADIYLRVRHHQGAGKNEALRV